jgi:hypothetical protein
MQAKKDRTISWHSLFKSREQVLAKKNYIPSNIRKQQEAHCCNSKALLPLIAGSGAVAFEYARYFFLPCLYGKTMFYLRSKVFIPCGYGKKYRWYMVLNPGPCHPGSFTSSAWKFYQLGLEFFQWQRALYQLIISKFATKWDACYSTRRFKLLYRKSATYYIDNSIIYVHYNTLTIFNIIYEM